MRLVSVETTPNPNSMKLNLDENLGILATFTTEQCTGCPDFIIALLKNANLKSVFLCADFITLNKDPRADWKSILEGANAILSSETMITDLMSEQRKTAESEGQVQIFVQTFRGIPIQVKVSDSQGDERVSLGAKFNEAAMAIQAETGADYLKERYWADHGIRYGSRQDIAKEFSEEIQGIFTDHEIQRAKDRAIAKEDLDPISFETIKDWLKDDNWHKRLSAISELGKSEQEIELLISALQDPQAQVRRMAAAALGATGSSTAVSALCESLLNDKSIAVRRTAGDALSDIGDDSAQSAICSALSDSNKLVRWRAARFLADLGSSECLPDLEKALNDPAFEVKLEIESAIQRINTGSKGLGPAWKRIMEQS